ncbi:MAG TPA: SIR2 family protein [Phycisphaerae bacterium]|nr:SIR2 family protein [Phycisphaerae bacterium]
MGRLKRYSDACLNPLLTGSRIVVLTGAGFTTPLGYPLSADVRTRFPEPVREKLTKLFVDHPHIHKAWLQDAEILLDLLLRVQRIAVLCPDEKSFKEQLHKMPFTLESLFVLAEQPFGDWITYPPLTHVQLSQGLAPNTRTAHFQLVRDCIYGVVRTCLTECYKPVTSSRETALDSYVPFLRGIAKCNAGPAPFFTTNYDRAVESIYNWCDRSSRLSVNTTASQAFRIQVNTILSNGRVSRQRLPEACRSVTEESYLQLDSCELALFHLHGCSNWFVNLKDGRVIEIEASSQERLAEIIQTLWYSPDGWQPACAVPAAVKDSYTISPPFNLAYDYLAEALKRARVLLIIGQSLRDETLKEMIFWSARANSGLHYVLVRKDSQPRGGETERERKLREWREEAPYDCIPKDRCTELHGGFPDSAAQILEICRDLLRQAT